MFDRRQVLLAGAAAAGAFVAALPAQVKAQTPAGELYALFDRLLEADLDASPEETSSLGLDTGERAWARRRLNQRSPDFIAAEKARLSGQLAQVRAFDASGLSGADRVNYDVVLFALQAADAANRRYPFGPGAALLPYAAAGAPYVLSPLTGAYATIPDFLDAQHPIASRGDADAYLARLLAFAEAMDQEIDLVRHDAAHGCTPPDFALAKTLVEMGRLRAVAPEVAGMTTSLARRAHDKRIDGDWAGAAAKIVREKVYPALNRQIAAIKALQASATHDAGVWKFKDGEQYYVNSLTTWNTTTLSPAIHRLGLALVADRSAKLDAIMRRTGLTQGTVGQRIRSMFENPKYRYPDTDAGREQLLANLDGKVHAVRAKLPQYFGVLPKADLVIKRVPAYMETARPRGYYQPPSLDGTRPGAFYVNLRNMAETPTWTLPTHAYHSGIPGHQLRFSVYQDAHLPLLRKLTFYSAWLEGWSLYAEQLADEMGVYDDDPLGRIGYLYSELRAAVALTIDSGLHALRWSREQGVAFFIETLGDPASSATTEVERYCIWPGQVTSYVLDSQMILTLRERTRAASGSRFDIRGFHDAILLCGPAPQSVLTNVVERYIAAQNA